MGYLSELANSAVERVEQKRTFFSYRIHRRGSVSMKVADFIHPKPTEEIPKTSGLSVVNKSSLRPVTLKSRKLELSRLY